MGETNIAASVCAKGLIQKISVETKRSAPYSLRFLQDIRLVPLVLGGILILNLGNSSMKKSP